MLRERVKVAVPIPLRLARAGDQLPFVINRSWLLLLIQSGVDPLTLTHSLNSLPFLSFPLCILLCHRARLTPARLVRPSLHNSNKHEGRAGNRPRMCLSKLMTLLRHYRLQLTAALSSLLGFSLAPRAPAAPASGPPRRSAKRHTNHGVWDKQRYVHQAFRFVVKPDKG